uniref:Uncharacterized protein n=1 Tax=Tanacetum cinerariifolium TaxID=118510 RepID=A0A6L2K735_TANCI|nr:hypothetical protein [Tanacetum cinerariifolium]
MENANSFVPVPPNELHARITQELNDLCTISAMIDSRFENIDHTQIIIPPHVLFEQLLNNFMNPADVFELDDLESDNKLVDTHLVSPFIDSGEELDDEEVLNELNEYRNAVNFYHDRIIYSIDGDDLAFPCMIDFRKIWEAFGKHLEEKHMNWSRFGKKLDKNTTLQAHDFHSDRLHKKCLESEASNQVRDFSEHEEGVRICYDVVKSKGQRVTTTSDVVTMTDKEKPLEDWAG